MSAVEGVVRIALAVCGLAAFHIADASAQTPAEKSEATPVAAIEAGVRGALDPETGELAEPALAEPGELESTPPLDAMPPQDFNQTWLETRPDGRVRAHLGDQFQMATFARIDADGSVVSWCEPVAGDATASGSSGQPHLHDPAPASESAGAHPSRDATP